MKEFHNRLPVYVQYWRTEYFIRAKTKQSGVWEIGTYLDAGTIYLESVLKNTKSWNMKRQRIGNEKTFVIVENFLPDSEGIRRKTKQRNT